MLLHLLGKLEQGQAQLQDKLAAVCKLETVVGNGDDEEPSKD